MATTTSIQPIFTVNERVLCYHGPLIYEAKVLKSHHHDESTTPSGQVGPHYFVHYKGWKQTYVDFLIKKGTLITTPSYIDGTNGFQQTVS